MFSKLQSYDVVITSYEVVRNDIANLEGVRWLYCILDEGHVIKNAKTKLTKAVKNIQAQHRLILSGTPIQNNVLELWSLFDFLMPGFLGTEAFFNERFGKPILANRDGKSKNGEAGTASSFKFVPTAILMICSQLLWPWKLYTNKCFPSCFVGSRKMFSTISLPKSFKTITASSPICKSTCTMILPSRRRKRRPRIPSNLVQPMVQIPLSNISSSRYNIFAKSAITPLSFSSLTKLQRTLPFRN